MWRSRISGLFVAGAGAALMAFIWSQVMDQNRDYLFIYRAGIPVVLLLSAIGTMAVVFGLHLLCAPRSPIRRWTPRPRRDV